MHLHHTKTLDQRLNEIENMERRIIALWLFAIMLGYWIAAEVTRPRPEARTRYTAKATKRARAVRRSEDGGEDYVLVY